ncbi:MAG: VanZ family protein [Planctomycetales bacterium]|nr:VanZ family protein [Planctomycetales bacterium]
MANFTEPIDLSHGRADLAVNVSVAVPLAFCVAGLFESLGAPLILAGLLAWAGGACLACFVELGQVWLPTRDASARDVLAQAAGHLVGVAAWGVLRVPALKWARALPTHQRVGERIIWLCYAYLVGVTFYLLLPLDVVSGPGELARKFASRQVELVPFSFAYPTRSAAVYAYVCDILRFVPIGVLAAAGWGHSTSRGQRGWWEAILLGTAVVIALECAQLLIASRFSSITDVILGSLGVMIGVALAPFVLRFGQPVALADGESGGSPAYRRPAFWLVAALAYTIVLCSLYWQSSGVIQDRQVLRERLRSFVSWRTWAAGSDVAGIFLVIQKVAWFAPLGVFVGSACLVVRMRAAGRLIAAAIMALACAAVCTMIELGQLPLASHTPSIIDVGLTSLACWAGMAVAALVWRAGREGRLPQA